jgi:hypothetical protein
MVKCKKCGNQFERLYNGEYSDYDLHNGTDTKNICNTCLDKSITIETPGGMVTVNKDDEKFAHFKIMYGEWN